MRIKFSNPYTGIIVSKWESHYLYNMNNCMYKRMKEYFKKIILLIMIV